MGFYGRHKKSILIGGGGFLALFILFLALGLAGVFDGSDSDASVALRPDQARLDCMPDRVLTEDECRKQKCIYQPSTDPNPLIPKCVRDPNRNGFYTMKEAKAPSETSQLFDLAFPNNARYQAYSEPFTKPQLMIERSSVGIMRLKFFDASNKRYEVPVPIKSLKEKADPELPNPEAAVQMTDGTTRGIKIEQRLGENQTNTIWDMSVGGLFLEDQFLQIATKLPSTACYGFGENRHPNLRHKYDWRTWSMFARDEPPTNPGATHNLYGVHPFYMCITPDGAAHGVLLWNSNALEYQFQPTPALTIRSIGGILDLYFFLGPKPEDVIRQYTHLTGRMFIPPYWGLGFQISRWGYEDLDHVKAVVKRNMDAKVPLDAVYGDIDYMWHRQDFTVDPVKYSGLSAYVKQLHDSNMRYVIILDPAIHVDFASKHPEMGGKYLAYTKGVEDDIYIKWPKVFLDQIAQLNNDSIGENNAMLGKVWPDGRCVFPDFFKPATLSWWEDMIRYTYENDKIEFDALWIDMNEVSSFDTNQDPQTAWYCNKPEALPGVHTCFALQCPKDSKFESPPFRPAAVRVWDREDRQAMLSDKTLCMVGETEIDGATFRQYDLHSLYGWSQAEKTARVAEEIRQKRSFAFSRSTFPGGQQYVGHWLGDNAGNFEELRYSLIGLMEFSMFGYGYVGADICGFWDNTPVELCARWMAAGAFYPFCRNHNAQNNLDQDPAVPRYGDAVVKASRAALEIRYLLLPYLYSLFYRGHIYGETVSRPLHHEFPTDEVSLNTDDQFLWGPALMISPIVQNVSERQVYVPAGRWYDYYTGEVRQSNKEYRYVWDGEDNVVALDVRGGYIIPHQFPGTTTFESRQQDFMLIIAAAESDTNSARGELYWDDGESIDPVKNNKFYKSEFVFHRSTGTLEYKVVNNAGPDMKTLHISRLNICDVQLPDPDKLRFTLTVDGATVDAGEFTAKLEGSHLVIKGSFPMDKSFTFQYTSAA